MSESDKKIDQQLDALLDELGNEEAPPMSAEFRAQAMDRIIQRKKELDALKQPEQSDVQADSSPAPPVSPTMLKTRKPARRFRAGWLAAAAALVFLVCGTLLTRGSLRQPADPTPGGNQLIGTPVAHITSEPEPSRILQFFGDMWLFLKAAFPYLAAACALGAVLYILFRKKR